MKKLAIFLSITCLLFNACESKKELSRDEALKQIKEQKNYPKVIDYDVTVVTLNLDEKPLMPDLKQKA